MLANNVIRINGWKNNKRSHVDLEVPMKNIEFYNNDHVLVSVTVPQPPHDIAKTGFENGLDGVTSFNMWNWVGNVRITERIL